MAKPYTHVHRYVWKDISSSVVESLHAAPFWHGLLSHSLTSMSQLPLRSEEFALSNTTHSVVYSDMKSYSHQPLAKPATLVHWYVCILTASSVVDSDQVAPF